MSETAPVDEMDFLSGDGDMAKLIRAKDWTATPLGPIKQWPQSLRTTVSLCLASNFPINIIWGPGHTQIYNDGYKVVCGEGHPAFLGMDYSVSWASAWPAIGEPFRAALAGRTSYLENQRMFLKRNGYLEETFFTFSVSPIRDETGGIGGLFHPVTETTVTMLGARRNRFIRDLTLKLGEAKTTNGVFCLALEILGTPEFDLPFVLLYRLTQKPDGGACYSLAARVGVPPGTTATPEVLAPDATAPWPVARLAQSADSEVISGLRATFGPTKCGPYEEPPDIAVAQTIYLPGSDLPAVLMIAGVSPRLPLNDPYRGFYDLVAAAIGAALARARTFEEERQRAEVLAAIDRAKTVFFSNVSHEFRTPLTLMLGPLEEALTEDLTSPQRERLAMSHRNALRLLKLVNTLLDFSRVEAGRIQACFEPVELATMTSDLASSFRSACQQAGVDLIVDCAPLDQPVYVDRDMWEKIVLNLISNAFKFTLHGSITVALHPAKDRVDLLVHDTGVGIPAVDLPRVFERFYRIEGQLSRTHEGSGIGLALVEELVKLHGGTIRVSSVLGQGSELEVSIPFGTAHLSSAQINNGGSLAATDIQANVYVKEALSWLPTQPAEPRQPDGNRNDLAMARQQPCIILVDDNADMRAYVTRILTQGGYVVEAVEDGEAALAMVRRGPPPDLILTDIMMPRVDGFGLLKELRADPATQGLLVVLLSARAGEEARVEGLAAGADDYLVKPFSARELLTRVDALISLARQRREAAERERDVHATLAKQESQRLLQAVVGATPGLIYAKDRRGRILLANPPVLQLIGKPWSDVQGRTDHEFLNDKAQAATVMANDRRIMETGQTEEVEELVGTDEGQVRAWLSTKTPLRDGDGQVVGLVGMSVEITERKRADDRLRLLVHELNHRVKNTLAVVHATAAQTLREIDPEVRRDFEGRLQAIAAAHDVLTRQYWSGAELNDVVVGVLAQHGGSDAKRFQVSGPRLLLLPRAAVALSMGLHELATNALKYGALSRDGGTVVLNWHVADGRFCLVWRESGGPPVTAPSRRGFGTRLIERSLAQDLGGSARLAFAPDGVVCTFEVPVAEVAQEAAALPNVGNRMERGQ